MKEGNNYINDVLEEELEHEITKLSQHLYTVAPKDGLFELDIPGLYVGRSSKVEENSVKTFNLPSFGFATQGAKAIMIEQEVYQYDNRNMFISPVALPVSLRTTEANPEKPFFGVRLDLDPVRISDLLLKVFPKGLPPIKNRATAYVTKVDPYIVNAMTRLFQCLNSKKDIELIAPLIIDEILIRLLRTENGLNIAEMGIADSELQKVSKAISWLRENFAQPVKVADLAELVHMSSSSFHAHFKLVTKMSPLQYQKVLRLHEARHLMLSQNIDAVTACRLTGYISDSQFSRDYSNYFGTPPKRDIGQLRHQLQ